MTECDVAVVGAGIVGTAVAYELAARGAAVTLLDARSAGRGSTQAAAGMLVPYIEGFGKPILEMAARSLGMYDEFVDRISFDGGAAIGYHRTGSLQVIAGGEPTDELDSVAESAAALGMTFTRLDAKQVRDAEPLLTPDATAGLLIPEHGFVAVGDLSSTLLAAGLKRGVRVHTPARVLRITKRGKRFDLELERDRLSAETVVLAAGSWSPQIEIAGIPPIPVRPVRGQLLELASDGPSLQRVTWGCGGYLVPFAPGSLLAGATMEEVGFDERITVAAVGKLIASAGALIPSLRQAVFAGARVGLRPATPDDLPIIGRSEALPGLVFATGHFRNGILLAPLTARVVAGLILEDRTDEMLEVTSPRRFGEF